MREMPREVRVQVDPLALTEAIRLLTGDPELVIVDFRVLRLLMGDLAGLIVLDRVSDPDFHGLSGFTNAVLADFERSEDESFAWDNESPCD